MNCLLLVMRAVTFNLILEKKDRKQRYVNRSLKNQQQACPNITL